MKHQPNRNYKSNDNIMTPDNLAKTLVDYFNPKGKGLEPCMGTGNFFKYLKNADWCEIERGRDFYKYTDKVDYILTNPPWSQMKIFLEKSLQIAKKDIYFLCTINHIWTKARLKLIKNYGFSIKEIVYFNTPKEFPQSGFQVGMIHLKKKKLKTCKITHIDY